MEKKKNKNQIIPDRLRITLLKNSECVITEKIESLEAAVPYIVRFA